MNYPPGGGGTQGGWLPKKFSIALKLMMKNKREITWNILIAKGYTKTKVYQAPQATTQKLRLCNGPPAFTFSMRNDKQIKPDSPNLKHHINASPKSSQHASSIVEEE